MSIAIHMTLSQAVDLADASRVPKWLTAAVVVELNEVAPGWDFDDDLQRLARALELRVAGRSTSEGAATSDDLRMAASQLRLYANPAHIPAPPA